MAQDFPTLEHRSRSTQPGIQELSDPARRTVLRGGLLAALAPAFSACASGRPGPWARSAASPALGFEGVKPSTTDSLVVADGYTATPFMPWGEPVGIAGSHPAPAGAACW
jgi:secreted PhoX family phosphatase